MVGNRGGGRTMPGAEEFWAEPGDGPLNGAGIVMCHGFTASPASVRGWAEHLAGLGAAVALPLLPGHGSTWQQLNLTTYDDWYSVLPPALDWVSARSRLQVVAGLSMGGALALRLAQLEPVSGVLLVNPSIGTDDRRYAYIPLLSRFVRSVPGIASDIKAPGPVEPAYDRSPLAAAGSLRRLWRLVESDLDRVQVPVLMFTSREDHVVDAYSGRVLRNRLANLTDHWLDDSYHVATMDNDAPLINQLSAEFIAGLLGGGDGPT